MFGKPSTKARQAQLQQKDEMRGQEVATVLKLVRSGLCPSVSDCIGKDETSLYQRFDVVLKISYALGKTGTSRGCAICVLQRFLKVK